MDLAITSSEDPIQDGTALTFTMTVSNPSATTLTNVVLEAVIPDYMSIRVSVETTPLGDCLSGSTCIAGGFIRWTLDTLSPGEVRVVRYSDVISTAASDGALLTAEAVVTADGVSAVQDSHTVVVSENAPRLQLSLSVDRNPAAPGALVIYQLRYSNSSESPDDLTANSLTAMLPQGMTFVSANGGGSETGGVVSWPISIASGIDGSREFTARVDSGLTNGTLLRIDAHFEDSVKNIAATAAVVLAVNATPSHDENTVPTRPGALAVTAVTGSSATVSWGASTDADGDTITYHVEYRRNGVESWSDGGSTSNVSKSISGLEEGQYYSVRVTPSDGTEDGPSRTALNLFRTVATEPFIYVALGDSYSSGTSARHYFDTSPEDTPEACLRSPAAYSTAPSRLLEELAISGKISGGNGIQHTFLACHGAKGHDVVRNSQMPGAPTQIGTSDLSEDTDLVTITIGGNDVGFAELMIFIVRNYDDGSGLDGEKFGSSDDSWMDVMKQRIKDLVDNGTALVDYRWDGFTYTKGVPLTEVLAKIKDKVSDTNTSIFLLGYPPIITARTCSWIDIAERNHLIELTGLLDKALRLAANKVGVHFLSMVEESEFAAHDVCSDDPWITNIEHKRFTIFNFDESFHPNELGHDEYVRVLQYFIENWNGPFTSSGLPENPAISAQQKSLSGKNNTLATHSADPAHILGALTVQTTEAQTCSIEGVFAQDQLLNLSGSGFAPNTDVEIRMHFNDQPPVTLGTVLSDGSGALDANLAVPQDALVGFSSIEAMGEGANGAGSSTVLISAVIVSKSYATDDDNDSVPNPCDSCPDTPNDNQLDSDQDGIGDACDVCPYDPNNDVNGSGLCGTKINAGLNDAWFNPATDGQGFFINVFPDIKKLFLAWFTYDTERPELSVTATLGDPGHRWLTAFGPYEDGQAVLEIDVTQGGLFNSSAPAPTHSYGGTITVDFRDCNAAVIKYSIPSIGQHGEVPIQRIVHDNVALCDVLGEIGQEATLKNSTKSALQTKNSNVTVQSVKTAHSAANATQQAVFEINEGLNDAWFNPATDGQGFFINVFPDIQKMFLAWFTYDTERPDTSIVSGLGDPGHRWITALGPYSGDQADLEINITKGGIFNSGSPKPTNSEGGTISVQFDDCESGTVTFDIPSIGEQGVVPIQRLAADNVALCEALLSQ